jgi:trans-aconitate 2-methyltransferase
MTVTWDPDRYDALPLPHEQWGVGVVDRLQLTGSEVLVDAGSGSGRDAALALSLLPEGRIICLDASASMRAACAARLSGTLQVDVRAADLMEPWPVESGTVDAVMSVAAFHWLPHPDRAWAQVARVLRPGGRIQLDAGGHGNIERLLAAVDEVGASGKLPQWHYAAAEETVQYLESVGLEAIDVHLRIAPAYFESDDIYLTYLKDVVLHHLTDAERLQVAHIMGDRCVDYVRLEVTATKPH